MASIGSVSVDLKANTGSFETDFARAARQAKKHSQDISTSAIAIGTSIGHFLSEAIEGVASFVEKSVESTVQLAHLAEKTGLSAQALGGLRLAATQSGVDMDRLGKTITKVSGIQFQAAAGSKAAAAEMRFFGITAKDTADTATDKLLKAFNAMPPSFDRAGLAVKIFGQRIGTDFLLVADKAKGGLNGLEQQAADLGVGLSENTLKAAEHFEISMGIIKLQAQSVGETIITGLLPTLDEFIKKLADPAINAEFKDIAAAGVGAFVQIITWAGKATEAIANFARDQAAVQGGAAIGDRPRLEEENQRIAKRLREISPSQVSGSRFAEGIGQRLFTDPYVTEQVGGAAPFIGVAADQERQILQKRLATNKAYLAETTQMEKAAAGAKKATDDAAAADAKTRLAATAKTQADYQKLLDALHTGGAGSKARSKKTAADTHDAEKLSRAIDGMAKAEQGWQNELQKTGNPIADEFAARLRKINEEAAAFAKDGVSKTGIKKFTDDMTKLAEKLRDSKILEFQQQFDEETTLMAAEMRGPVAVALHQYQVDVAKLNLLLKQGAITQTEYNDRLNDLGKMRDQATGAGAGDWRNGAKAALADYETQARDVAGQTHQVFSNAFQGMEDALVNFTMTGKLNFKDFAKSLIADIERMIIKWLILKAIQASGYSSGGAFSSGEQIYAKGAAFAGGNVIPFARGGVVSQPTIFPMANGAGLMGEAGPEAIMPLTRGRDGKLGVVSNGAGGGSNVNSSVTVIIQSDGTQQGSNQSDDAKARQLGESVRGVVVKELIQQQRQGGILWGMANR